MVLITAFVGFYLGLGGCARLSALTADACSAPRSQPAARLALNQFLERDTDALMERTRRRPLPDGRLQPREALWFGIALCSPDSSISRWRSMF